MQDRINAILEKDSYNVYDMTEIVRILRSENGCPWDKVQTHSSIKKDMIEEAYEVAEAIDFDSPEMMREELGDVMLQVVFHTVIEE
ncbi:MAG: nucleoside triphosphate pyrophosphohydrolase, partial [Ruminococcus sp.]|nr:nucleoside triphosphate pyrophosphohydrolase [Ruminococcus sp.]